MDRKNECKNQSAMYKLIFFREDTGLYWHTYERFMEEAIYKQKPFPKPEWGFLVDSSASLDLAAVKCAVNYISGQVYYYEVPEDERSSVTEYMLSAAESVK